MEKVLEETYFSEQLERNFIEVAEMILPSIVTISTARITMDRHGNFTTETGSASGVVITDDGLIITSQHVVNDKDFFNVRTNSGEVLQGKLVGSSKLKDLALIQVENNNGITPIDFASYDTPRIGQFAMVAGNPLGMGTSVAFGMISGINRVLELGGQYIDGLIQTTAPMNFGNSGGALVDSKGYLIGIATATIGAMQGISFATSIEDVKKLLDEYFTYGCISTPWIGIGATPVNEFISKRYGLEKEKGVIVIVSRGPAKEMGIKSGDIVVSIDNNSITDTIQMRNLVNKYRGGDRVKIVFLRDGNKNEIELVIGEYDA